MRWLIIVVAAFALSVPSPSSAQVRDLKLSWHSIRSQHFEVHYPENLEQVAQRALAALERAQSKLGTFLAWTPKRRVHVVVTDTSEFANGSANPLPYNVMRLFVSAPDDLSTLSDYDDWLTTLISHEYAHILHLDTIRGIPAIVNKVLGKTMSPNLTQPRWIIEGLATLVESRQTSGGRLRSTLFEMYLRTAVLENAELRIDQLSNNVDAWPRGNTWYLYGSRFLDFITERHGDDFLRKLSREYGTRLIPFAINRSLERVTGETFTDLYGTWIEGLHARYGELKRQIVEQGMVRGERLTFHGESTRAPRYLDANTLVYFMGDQRRDPQIRTLTLNKAQPSKQIARISGLSYPAKHPDGSIIYNSIESYRNLYFYNDLFRTKIGSRKRTRLTKGLRAAEPDVSADGKTIAFVINQRGTRHLVLAELKNIKKSMRVIVRSKRFEQVYTPRFSPDGRYLAYSVWKTGGYRDIHVMDLENQSVRRITADRAMDTGPAWSRDGSKLYFSSDRTGIANIYAWRLETNDLVQITNEITGAYHPAPSPDGQSLVYLGYNYQGFDLYKLPLAQAYGKAADPYIDQRPSPSPVSTVARAKVERYKAARSLYPRAYEIEIVEDGFGQQLGLLTEGADAVGFYSFDARLGISLENAHVHPSARFTFHRSPAPITLRAFRSVSPRTNLVVAGQRRTWTEERVGGSISAAYPILRAFSSQTLSMGYGLTHLGKLKPFGGTLDPNTPPPFVPDRGFISSTFFSWSFSDARQYAWDISASRGRTLFAGVTLNNQLQGGPFKSTRFDWAARRFIRLPWALNHVFALSYVGGKVRGSLRTGGFFSIGGFPSQSFRDIVIDNAHLGGRALRGYPAFSRFGDQVHLIQAEYRLPLVRIQAGPQTLPLYLNRLSATIFTDWGDTFFGPLNLSTFRAGSGAELLLDFTMAYTVAFKLRTGIAYGWHQGGGTHFYANLGIPF